MVNSELHYVVDDVVLRDRVRSYIEERHYPQSAYDGDDAVLIMAEVA
jgi:hypothetical protein